MTQRRDFLKGMTVAGAAAGAGILPRRIQAQGFQRVVYRDLGETGFKASELGFGAMNTRDPELIQAAIDSGINYIDTAHGYMKGENERIVGSVIKKNDRSKLFVVTKVHIVNRTASEAREMMETSLDRLQMDHVDIMFSHMPDTPEDMMQDHILSSLEKAKKDGLCRFVGVSTHKNQADILNAAADSGFFDAVLVGYNYESDQAITDAIERARKAGIAIIAMKTQLKGKGWPDHDMGDMTINQAALKWVLENPYVDTTIPGMTAFEQLTEDHAVMGMRMSFRDHRDLKRYGMKIDRSYCRGVAGCTGCQDQCPMGVEVCDINRCVGYADGYGDLRLARENYDMLPARKRADVCGDCDECVVKCVHGLDLAAKIRRARELFA